MPGQVTVQEATGGVALPGTDVDQRLAVLGCAYAGSYDPLPFGTPGPIGDEYTAGPLVRDAKHVVARTRIPLICVRTVEGTPGAYQTIDLSDWTGTAVPTPDTTSVPRDEYVGYWVIVDGGDVGTDGITYYQSDDDGRTLSGLKRLGTATTLEIAGTGVKVILDPPVAGLVALAAEIRTDILAHFANAVAHNSADATAAAIIVAGAPTTQAQAITVLNQCRLAWISHLANDTAHDSIDLANAITAPAATSGQTAVALANQLKAKINAHEAATYPADVDSLLVATATTVAIQSYDDSTLNAAGIAQLDGYPNEITFTTAGGTPADAPATVDIAGYDETGAAQTETGLALSQIAGTVTSTKKWRGTGLSVTYAAGDGPGATISIGTVASAHNSADATNTVSTANAATGTVVAGDVIRQPTTAPKWSEGDLADAFAALAATDDDCSLVLIPGRVLPSEADTISTGLNVLRDRGKKCAAIVQARKATDLETEPQWIANLNTEWENVTDSRLVICAGDYWCTFTDGNRTRVYDGRFNAQYARRLVGIQRYVSSTRVNDGPLEDVAIVNELGQLIGHDEQAQPGLDAGRFTTLFRIPNTNFRRGAYVSEDLVARGDEERVYSARVRRGLNAMARVAEAVGWTLIGETFDVETITPTTGRLAADAASAIAKKIAAPIREGFANDISDAEADDLVVVGQDVTISGDQLYVETTINCTFKKTVGRVDITIDIRVG